MLVDQDRAVRTVTVYAFETPDKLIADVQRGYRSDLNP
jgi:hypothetical protein